MMKNGFTFNSQHCSEFGVVMRSVNRMLLPRLQPRQVKIPGRHGLYDLGDHKYENRLLALDCFVQRQGLPELRQLARELAHWLSVKARLVFDDEPDKYYLGRLYEQVDFENILGSGFFSLVFEVEPFAHGESLTVSKTVTTADKIELNYLGTAPAATTITITNTGENTINGFTLTYGRLNDGSN